MAERTWEIDDVDANGRQIRRVITLAQYRAEIEKRKVYTARIATAAKHGIDAVASAQADMRKAFPNDRG